MSNDAEGWDYRLKQAIGFLIPALPAVIVLIELDRRITLESIPLGLWESVAVIVVSLLWGMAFVAWAVRGRIPPRY